MPHSLLRETHPALYEELVSMVDGSHPAAISAGSPKKAIWEGACKHIWEAPVKSRTGQHTGCPYCANQATLAGFNDLSTSHPDLANEWHLLNAIPVEHVRASSAKPALWTCPNKHTWTATPITRTRHNRSCPTCKQEARETARSPKKRPTPTQGVCPAGHKWELSATTIKRHADRGTILCPLCRGTIPEGKPSTLDTHPHLQEEWATTNTKHLSDLTPGSAEMILWRCANNPQHSWSARLYTRTRAKNPSGCPTCANRTSKAQQTVLTHLRTWLPETAVEENNRTILNGLELDIYLPDHNLAVEYNGVYWHTEEQGKGKWSHHHKWQACHNLGIQLIQIWEDDWERNPELVLATLQHKLGINNQPSVMARKTTVTELSTTEAATFLNENHLQGSATGSIRLGLRTTADQLVAVLVAKREHNGTVLNILRYATSRKVPGGFTKLLTHAERTYQPETVITFSDHTISDGSLYKNNQFQADAELAPDYSYVVGQQRVHKFNYRLKRFHDDPNLLWQENLSESQLATLNGLPRIWDAGKTRWKRTTQVWD